MSHGAAACLIVLSTVPWCAVQAAPQEPQPARAVFSSRADLVVLHVSVLDRKARLVSGLPLESFTVYEDGRPQQIEFFANEESPATVGLVLDASASMHRNRKALIAAATTFARSTHPRDEIFTVHFNERIWFGLPPGQAFTSDPAELRAALNKLPGRGRTSLFDAVTAAVAHVERGSSHKKALVVVSDGGDNSSRASFADVLETVRRSNAAIYTVSLADEYGDGDPGKLEKLAEASGGTAISANDVDDASKILERIARDIHSGYTIGYVTSATTAGGRRIDVAVSAPNRSLSVRTRSAYGAR